MVQISSCSVGFDWQALITRPLSRSLGFPFTPPQQKAFRGCPFDSSSQGMTAGLLEGNFGQTAEYWEF